MRILYYGATFGGGGCCCCCMVGGVVVLHFPCCMGFSLVMESGGYSPRAVHGLLTAVASLVAAHRFQGTWASVAVASGFSNCGSQVLEHRLNSCVPWAYLLHCIWNLPESGIKLMSPTLAGRFFITEPPEKPRATVINICKHVCLCFKYKYSDGNKSDLSFFQVSHA